VNSEKKLLEIKDELNKRDRYRLVYTALLVLALGIVLHASEASRETGDVEHPPTLNEACLVPSTLPCSFAPNFSFGELPFVPARQSASSFWCGSRA